MINTELIADGTSLATLLQKKGISEPFFFPKNWAVHTTQFSIISHSDNLMVTILRV